MSKSPRHFPLLMTFLFPHSPLVLSSTIVMYAMMMLMIMVVLVIMMVVVMVSEMMAVMMVMDGFGMMTLELGGCIHFHNGGV